MLSRYILILILFIFVFHIVSNMPKISKKLDKLKLDNIKTKIKLTKKFNKTYIINNIKNLKIENKSLCLKNECIKLDVNVSIKGGIIYVGN